MLVQRATRELLHGAHFVEHLIARSAADFAPQRLDHTQWRDRRPHGHGHEFGPTTREAARELSERIIKLHAHLVLIVASESPMAHMANSAHYHKGGRSPCPASTGSSRPGPVRRRRFAPRRHQ